MTTLVDVPRELLHNAHPKVIRASPDLVSIQRYSPISISSNTLGFVWQSPSFSSLLCEKLLLSFQSIRLNLNFTGQIAAGATVAFSTLGSISLRSFPIERLVNTLQVVLGSSSINFAQSDTAEATIFASYDNNDYVSNAGSFEYPPSEVGGHMGAVITSNPAQAPNTPNPANLLCAQTSSSTGSYILSGTPGTPAKGSSLYIEGVYCAHPQWNGNGWFNNTAATIDISTFPVQVQVSIAGFLKANIFEWAVKEAPQCLTNLSQLQLQMILNNPQTMLQYLEPVFFDAIARAQPTATQVRLSNVAFDMNNFTTQKVLLSAKYISVPANYSFKDTIRQYWQTDRYISTSNTLIAPYSSSQINPATGGTALAQYPNAGTVTVSSNSFTLATAPRYIMIFAKPSRSFYNSDPLACGVQNFFLPIVNLSVTIGNRTSLLTTATIESLYSLSCEASLKGKYSVFKGFGGALPAGNTIVNPVFGNPSTSAVFATNGAQTIGNPSNVALNYECFSGLPIILDCSTALGYDHQFAWADKSRSISSALHRSLTLLAYSSNK